MKCLRWHLWLHTVSGNQTTQISNLSWTVGSTSAVAYSYTYDAVGNILTVSENNTLKASYTYDEQNQLLIETLWDTGIRYEYTYDTYGNIRSVKEYNANTGALISSDTYSYTNSTWLDRLTAFNGTTITYDNSGNPLSYNNGSAYTFTWDGRELASVVKGGVTTNYTYGADGLRTQKKYGSTTYNYYYVDGQLVRMTWANSYIDFLYDESGSIYSFVYDGNQYYYVKNLQGDVVQIYSIWGTKAVEYSYDAWGNCTVVSEDDNYTGLAETNPIRYRGYVYDFETGFYYLQSRYYDPYSRRFINSDEVAYLGINGDYISYNLYAYCLNNPINCIDSTGEFALTAFLGAVVGGAIGGAVISAVSHVVSASLSGKEVTLSSMTNAVLTGAACGALGGAIGSISLVSATATLVAKGVASVAVGTAMGIKTGIESEGTTQQRVWTGIATGVLTAGSTFLGSQIDTSGFGFAGSAFANYASTLFVGTFAEIGAVAAQQTIGSLGSKSTEVRVPNRTNFAKVCMY